MSSIPQTGAPPAPAKPSAINYSFRITLEGFMLLIVMILVGFAAWHSGTNLLYLIFAILIAFYLMHGGLLWINLMRLSVKQQQPETVVVHQPFDVAVTLTNGKKRFASYSIAVSHCAPAVAGGKKPPAMGTTWFACVGPGKSEESYYSAVVHKRGWHEISSATICTRYPFGFEERSQTHRLTNRVLALPATYNVATVLGTLPQAFGDQETNVRGSGTDLYGLREYVPGDHARHIHWRTSARAQKLMLSEYSIDQRQQVTLFLNNSVPAADRPALQAEFENAITLTASMARRLLEAGLEVGLVTAANTLPAGQGSTQLFQILRQLALLEMEEASPIKPGQDQQVIEISFQRALAFSAANWKQVDSRQWRPPAPEANLGQTKL